MKFERGDLVDWVFGIFVGDVQMGFVVMLFDFILVGSVVCYGIVFGVYILEFVFGVLFVYL